MNLPIETVSVAEKLDAMEQQRAARGHLWWILSGASPTDCLPDWHAIVLEQRRQRIEQGETTFSSLEEVKARLRNQDK